MATPKDDDDANLLTVKSKSTLMRLPVARLRAFCEDHGLTVSSTGKTGPIKKDYVVAIWFHNKASPGTHNDQSDPSTTVSLIRPGEDLDGPFAKRQKTDHSSQEVNEPTKSEKIIPSFVRIIDQTNSTIAAARRQLVDKLRRDDQTEVTIAGSRKRLGDCIEAPSTKRQKKNTPMAEPVGSHTKVVVVRLYKSRLDWDYVREARVSCDIYGRLDLEEVRKQLGVQEKCRLLDPQNKWPFYLYNGTIVDSGDIIDLMEDGCLQAVCEPNYV